MNTHLTRWKGLALAVIALPLLAACGQARPAPEMAAAEEPAWSPPPLAEEAGEFPDGREVVRRAIDFMQSHERLGFEVIATYEVLQDNGQKLEFDMLQRVAFEQGSRLYWATLNDDAATETAWCEGGTFTMIRQPANVWGQVKVPVSLPSAISTVADEYGVSVPFVDILAGEAADLWLGDDVEWVDYIGEAWAEGHWTDHVALRRPGADIQLWFRADDEPFPIKMTIVRTDDEGLPAFSARFREWKTQIPDGSIPDFAPPEDAEQLEIVPIVGR
jgi:hypothetical protein